MRSFTVAINAADRETLELMGEQVLPALAAWRNIPGQNKRR